MGCSHGRPNDAAAPATRQDARPGWGGRRLGEVQGAVTLAIGGPGRRLLE